MTWLTVCSVTWMWWTAQMIPADKTQEPAKKVLEALDILS